MKLNLNIDRLILDNIDLAPRQRYYLQLAIEAELSQLLSSQGIPAHLQAGGAIPNLSIGPLNPAQSSNPQRMGQHIAQQIYHSLSQPTPPQSPISSANSSR